MASLRVGRLVPARGRVKQRFRHSGFVILSSLGISSFVIAVLWASAPLFGQEYFDSIVVAPEPVNANSFQHGYLEHRVNVSNRSAKQGYQVTLLLPNESSGWGDDHLRAIRRTAVVGPSSDLRMTLPQPCLWLMGDTNLGVFLEGRYKGPAHHTVSNTPYYGGGPSQPPRILVSRGLNSQVLEDTVNTALYGPAPTALTSTPPRGGPRTSPTAQRKALVALRSETDVGGWSESWLAYSSYDGVVVTAEDMARMPATARQALWSYVECGGTLLVMGRSALPASSNLTPCDAAEGVAAYSVGFGLCVVATQTSPDKLDKAQIQFLKNFRDGTLQPWLRERTRTDANSAFPVIKDVTLPIRTLFSLLLGLAILIGPVNLIVPHRLKRQIWMLWTIPAISVAATLSVVIYAYLSEGVTPTLRLESFTILDQVARRATTLGMVAYYCPVTPRDGLHFSHDTEVSPVGLVQHSTGGSARTMDWTRDQHLDSGWVAARVPTHLVLRKSEPRRERLEVTRAPDGAVVVVNGLGADIAELRLLSPDGHIHRGRQIKAGTLVGLERESSSEPPKPHGRVLRYVYEGDWTHQVPAPGKDLDFPLRPNTYVALLEASPFLEKGLNRTAKETTRSLVFGILGEKALQ